MAPRNPRFIPNYCILSAEQSFADTFVRNIVLLVDCGLFAGW